MLEQYKCVDNTPSVYFHFDESNMKSDKDRQYVPYQYSNTTHRFNVLQSPNRSKTINVTPLIKDTNNSKKNKQQQVKIDTEQFFEDFQENFVVKFGDSPLKCEFSKHLDFNFIENDENQKQNICNAGSNLSGPINLVGVQNQQSAENSLKKSSKIVTKVHCEIRKRVLFKNNEALAQKGNSRKNDKRIINDKNLLIVSSNNWTGRIESKKEDKGPYSHPVKSNPKKIIKNNSNIFTTHPSFRETLRSTTLDNWRKKHNGVKQRNYFGKNAKKAYNLFEKPFSIIR